MNVIRYQDAPRYDAPGHSDMVMRRLQGLEAGKTDSVWIGLSVINPGGGTTSTASSVEKLYVVLEGEVQITAIRDGNVQTAILGTLDSCRIAPGEHRQLFNAASSPAKILLAMPHS